MIDPVTIIGVIGAALVIAICIISFQSPVGTDKTDVVGDEVVKVKPTPEVKTEVKKKMPRKPSKKK